MKKMDKPEQQDDVLQICLNAVVGFYSMQVDMQGMVDNLPRETHDHLEIDDVVHIGDNIGFDVSSIQLNTDNFKNTKIPYILLFEDKTAYVLYPQKTHENKVFIPGKGLANLEDIQEKMANYSGKAIAFAPGEAVTGLNTEHMYEGHVFDWFWKPIFSNWPRYSEIILCTIFINLFVLALPLYTMNIYDRVVSNFVESTLVVLTVGITLALFFDFILKTIRNYLLDRIGTKIGIEYDHKLMERLMNIHSNDMPLSVGERSNLFRELQSIRDFYATRLMPTIIDLPFFLLFVLIVYLINPFLALVPICGSLIIFLANIFIQIPIKRATKNYFSSIQMKSTMLFEILQGLSAIHMFNAIGTRLFKWNTSVSQAAESARYNGFLIATTSNFSVLVSNLVQVLVVFFGAYQISEGLLTTGGLIACSILSGRSIAPVMALSGVVARYKQSKDVLQTIDKIFQLPHDGEKGTATTPKGPFKGIIKIEGMNFQYPDQKRVALDSISLSLKENENVGFIGRSGAGKSTLAKIITGQLKAQEGAIFLDSYEYDSIPPMELRRTIGVVPQDSVFFSGSIRENILLNSMDISNEQLEKIIYISGLDLVMEQTGCGLDMDVGEGGKKLSGGQRQSIAIARALVYDPRILVFDEPTTGMDHILEARMRTELAKYLKGRSFIMITHRTTLLPLVDRLVLLDNGKIMGDGPRDEILTKLSGGTVS